MEWLARYEKDDYPWWAYWGIVIIVICGLGYGLGRLIGRLL